MRVAVATAVIVGLVTAHRPILSTFAGFFRVNDPAPSEAIVLLLGGADHRPNTAAALYRRGVAPVVLLGTALRTIAGESDETLVTANALETLGVPRSAIVILPGTVTSTREEAASVSRYAATHPMRRITVVTTAFHTARARWVFRKVLRNQGIDVRMAAATSPHYNEADWYKTDEGLLAYFNEAFKTIYYRVRY